MLQWWWRKIKSSFGKSGQKTISKGLDLFWTKLNEIWLELERDYNLTSKIAVLEFGRPKLLSQKGNQSNCWINEILCSKL